jgi:hypothetical protein
MTSRESAVAVSGDEGDRVDSRRRQSGGDQLRGDGSEVAATALLP